MESINTKAPTREPIWAALSRPFVYQDFHVKVLAVNKDKTRGLIVPHVDARAVMDRLDSVVGQDGWSDTYDILSEGVVRCRLTIVGITIEDVGLGDDPKSAFSDALKRTAVKFGSGRHLYDAEKLWGPLYDRGQIKDEEEAKRRVLGPTLAPIADPVRATRGRALRSSEELIPNTTYAWRVRAYNRSGEGPWSSTFSFNTVSTTGVETLPVAFTVSGVYPNPARQHASVDLMAPQPQPVSVSLFDALGKRRLYEEVGRYAAGKHTVDLDLQGLPASVYILSVRADLQLYNRLFQVVR